MTITDTTLTLTQNEAIFALSTFITLLFTIILQYVNFKETAKYMHLKLIKFGKEIEEWKGIKGKIVFTQEELIKYTRDSVLGGAAFHENHDDINFAIKSMLKGKGVSQ